MKPILELNLGFRDAESYKLKDNKELFNKIFIRTEALDDLLRNNRYFLIGEKGTGKTAFAVYLTNSNYKNTNATLKYIRETGYEKFIYLKNKRQLELSDYTSIWKVILLLLIAEFIAEREIKYPLIQRFTRFHALKQAIDDFYDNAFSPEIDYAIRLVEESSLGAKILNKFFKMEGTDKETREFTERRFQVNLFYIQKKFQDALRQLKLKQNYILFIDGIDIRPSKIEYNDYLDCIKGLANALWSLNNDFFGQIKDSPGRIKVVLLIRPDIFNSLGLQNQNSKIKDNSVILDWQTTYPEYRNSKIFLLADKLLSYQQDKALVTGEAWDYYFPFNATNVLYTSDYYTSFISVLRYTLYRPRDILVILSILKENFIEDKRNVHDRFTESDLHVAKFTRKYSDYYLGEIKDHLVFYYTPEEYEYFLKFFQFLEGHSRFTYDQYIVAYNNCVSFFEKNGIKKPSFCSSPDNFLQFLYEMNVLSYIIDTDNKPFFGWCYRERTPSNISPKVKTGVRYEVHYGLMKSLDLGKKFKEIS